MNRQRVFQRDANPSWTEVSRLEPCPRCGRESGCSVSTDAPFVRCLSIVSERPVAAGGWLHVLEGDRTTLAAS